MKFLIRKFVSLEKISWVDSNLERNLKKKHKFILKWQYIVSAAYTILMIEFEHERTFVFSTIKWKNESLNTNLVSSIYNWICTKIIELYSRWIAQII